MLQLPNDPAERRALQVVVRGVVQGVGFRPFVFRLARALDVHGWVRNDPIGVVLHIEADSLRLDSFLTALREEAPPAAELSSVETFPTALGDYPDFQILGSTSTEQPITRISPDLAVCEDCLRELRTPGDPRCGYPYINCTNCGPRYSIITALPYDRPNTSMSDWPLCSHCAAEYADPLNRRFHAQPVACPACGPNYRLERSGVETIHGPAAIAATVEWLRAGAILALKGIGGYHLACDAQCESAVRALRERKYRKDKPFAILLRDLEQARSWLELTPAHEALLSAPARPIVLARPRRSLPGVAPDNSRLGAMLPYAPLHALLFDAGAPSPLVLTSANRASEPIAYRDEHARRMLAGLADAFLIGERRIVRRVDDSVAEVQRGQPLLVRRARGYAPGVVARLPTASPLLALGADLKNSLTLVVRGEAFMSQHIGDLGDEETDRAQRETVADWLAMYRIEPAQLTIVHDLHPEYHSTRLAHELAAGRRCAVQHHHAHIAATAAEHERFDERMLGVALDGTGYGSDGTIWGGEFLLGSVRRGYARVAHLRPVRLPGGDAAARWPVQAAAGFLEELTAGVDFLAPPFRFPARYTAACRLLSKNIRCFTTTSTGRLFDAVAALLGFTGACSYEGQAAIWLEHLAADDDAPDAYPFDGCDTRPLLEHVIAERLRGLPPGAIARRFHLGLARGLADRATALAAEHRLTTVVLSGGVFQNELLRNTLQTALEEAQRLEVLWPRRTPINDGGISFGQAALASCLTG